MDFQFPFVGRQPYIDQLCKIWEDLRCIGVYGMRSIGKSRFVRHLLPTASKQCGDKDYVETWIDLRSLQFLRQLFFNLAETLDIQNVDGEDDIGQAVLCGLSKTNRTFIVVFDNAEDVIDSNLKTELINIVKLILNQSEKIKVIVTSTSHLHSYDLDLGASYDSIELPPFTILESRELLQITAPNVKFGDYLDPIVDLCEGLPLALLLTGSELDQDDGLLEPCDMVELLNTCRLKVLSQDLYPVQERIDKIYGQFLNRLSSVLKEKLGILGYIPGTFSLQQASRILGEECEEDMMKETMMPIVHRHVIQYNSPTRRFDIHGILRDCISEFLKIQNLPEIRTRYCKMFAELMMEVSQKVESSQYAEALSVYNMEQQNFHKLMTDVIYTNEDTYPVYIDLVTTAFPVITRFVAVDSFSFIEKVLDLTRRNKQEVDEAFVCVTYANVLTNLKGNYIDGERNYMNSIEKMKRHSVPLCLAKARAHQGLGWNLGCQGKPLEAISVLKKALQYETELGLEEDELMCQTLTSLALSNSYAGFFEEGEYYHFKSLKKRIKRYGTEDHPAIGSSYNNIGILYKMKGDHSKALEYYQMGLDIKRKTKATDKSIVMSLNNVAMTLSELGRHDEGIDILVEAFDMMEKYPGFFADCQDLTNDTMGLIYLQKEDYLSAIKYLNKGLQGRVAASPTHVCILEERVGLAKAYVGLKEYSKAQTDLTETLKHKKTFISQMPQNRFIYDSYKILMEIAKQLGSKDKMESYHTHCRAELYRLTKFFEDLGNLQRAEEMAENLKSVQKIYNSFEYG